MDIRAVSDPTPPVFTGEDLALDAEREIDRLLQRIRAMTEQQLADQVYQRSLFCLCNLCYARWLENPFGA